jgi:ANTAR domain/PAS fold
MGACSLGALILLGSRIASQVEQSARGLRSGPLTTYGGNTVCLGEAIMSADSVPMEAVASGSSQVIGHYHYDILTGRWQWDDHLYRIHGYQPGEVTVDLDLILSHKHPDDRDEASDLIAAALMSGEPFSAYQRIITACGDVRNVVKVGSGVVDEDLHVVALDGFYIDLTASVRHNEAAAADQAVLAATAHRAAIEQAKGMIMLTHRVDAEAAFSLLSWWSMKCNVKLHLVAERLVAYAAEFSLTDPGAKLRLDQALFDIANRPDHGLAASPNGLVDRTPT